MNQLINEFFIERNVEYYVKTSNKEFTLGIQT